jgi:dihydrodipicolinate synthase/N-acetylneuraminate lyase
MDCDSLRNLVRALAGEGCHGLTLFGIAGEYYKLNEQEQLAMVRITVEEGRRNGIPTLASVTRHATELAVREAKTWQDMGADGLMLLPPFFLKPGAAALCRHAVAVGQAVGIPVMLQYAPEQTGVAVAPEMLAEIAAEAPNVSIFKIECQPPEQYISRLLSLAPDARVFAGNAGFQAIEALDRGAIGLMPGCSMAHVYRDIFQAYMDGRRGDAIRIHNALLPVLNHIRQDVEMIIHFEKKILCRRGLIATDVCRAPAFRPDTVHERLFLEYYEAMCAALAPMGTAHGVD